MKITIRKRYLFFSVNSMATAKPGVFRDCTADIVLIVSKEF